MKTICVAWTPEQAVGILISPWNPRCPPGGARAAILGHDHPTLLTRNLEPNMRRKTTPNAYLYVSLSI